ncbi:unnamed protein product, partial [Didymodactylos carnosus]
LNCNCTRKITRSYHRQDPSKTSLCNEYSTIRGPNQKIISISLFGPKESARFSLDKTIDLLNDLISDMYTIYPDWILRVYHDSTIVSSIACSIECKHYNVDFCNVSSLLKYNDLTETIPPKIWRFLPVGDVFVKIINSRDLDSLLTYRELAAVQQWLLTNKSFHAMRDHPDHDVPMLAGMWGLRTDINSSFCQEFLNKILYGNLTLRYHGHFADQSFLFKEIWPRIQNDLIVHDSFKCQFPFGKNSLPFPTQRLPFNETNCFVGCYRPCCGKEPPPFDECPAECRPKDHPEWTTC